MGLLFAFLGTAAWGAAVSIVGPGFSKRSVLYWNLGAELVIYTTVVIALDLVHRGLRNEHALALRVTAANAALDREARAVGDLQREMLPSGPPVLAGYEWQVQYSTSTHAGGDYYDFFVLPQGRLGVFLGDASGHGPQAAVLMAMMRVLLHTSPEPLLQPGPVLSRLAEQIAQTVPVGRFATACYCVLDPASGALEFCLAGHPPPFIVRRTPSRVEALPLRGGPPLGWPAPSSFEAGRTVLEPGDTLMLYTDGLTEAMGPGQQMFGEGPLRATLEDGAALPLVGLRDRVLARLEAHTGGAPLDDDLTLLLLRRLA
jgi:sigma-B regulation protein RsbU (phosphoserine phosphatase)